jgi:uncharacterized protein YqgC (DUF456 family)
MTTVLLWILAALLVLVGVAGVFLPALPGAVLVFAGFVLAAWIDGFTRVGWGMLSVLGALTALSYAAEFLAMKVGAKRFGMTNAAVVGASVGLLAGFAAPPLGFLLFPFLGAVIGEFWSVGELRQAGRAGVGAWLGLLFGLLLKLAIVFAMIGLFVAAYFL